MQQDWTSLFERKLFEIYQISNTKGFDWKELDGKRMNLKGLNWKVIIWKGLVLTGFEWKRFYLKGLN